MTPFQSEMAAYRRLLITNESTMQSEFDKHILTFSTGALALSISFLKDVLNQHWVGSNWLVGAWISWAFSICGIVCSFFTSAKAMRTAVAQTDDMMLFKAANEGNLGGVWNNWTKRLNLIGGGMFLAGVLFMVCFTTLNLLKDQTASNAAAASTK
jgi:hypothetical protein